MSKIIYTKTDEAPALAIHSLLPIIKVFTAVADILVETKDISLAGRVIANFPDFLEENQKIPNALTELGKLVLSPDANIIKFPNISASVPQLHAVIKELQSNGFKLPNYPDEPQSNKEKEIKSRYDKIKGSAVNPVLRQGNSDRRIPKPVKEYAKLHPHSMGIWSADSKTHVASMIQGDFYGSEKSMTVNKDEEMKIEFIDINGKVTVLKAKIPILAGEIIDTSVLSLDELKQFIAREIKDAKSQDVLFSLHLKATMMKVSDSIMFGAVVTVFFKEVFDKHASIFDKLGVDANNGLGDVYAKIQSLDETLKAEIEGDIQAVYKTHPEIAMVNFEKGITNLHVPSDVIIDASMPAAIRTSGQMWNSHGNLKDIKAIIPDRCYAGVYQETINFCKKNGAFNPSTIGSVSNVGLMAQKAEEYGSHDKTFQMTAAGLVRIINEFGNVMMEQEVKIGDIFRMCQVKDDSIKDWVKLAVNRGKATNLPVIFWLDSNRAHDLQLIEKVKIYLLNYDIADLDIKIMSPVEATRFSLKKIKEGKDVISITGNVLRDYLTDLFPILEVGTSAKMLSIVPLMNGGGLFETGSGGSAPKHVQQFNVEGHLRWDSLGEFLALAVSLEHLSNTYDNPKAKILAETLNKAISMFLENDKSPSRKVNELDNRGSHFYLAMYWAQELAKQPIDSNLQNKFSKFARSLAYNESTIIKELNDAQGKPVDIGGYYLPNDELTFKAMNPSKTFNRIMAGM